MYSQNNEEQFITQYFRNNLPNGGRYLEIGSFNAFIFSNTRALFEMGWSGVLVEPNPICMQGLIDVYGKEPRIKLIEAAVTNSDGTIKFFMPNGDAIGTTDTSHKKKWEENAGVKYSEIEVKTISMQNLLKEHGEDIDFINIDVEGTNMSLFYLIPDDFFRRLKMICIEHDYQNKIIEQKLTAFGFKTLLLNGENLIMAK